MIYVDPLFLWPGKVKKGAERTFGNGRRSCHMTCDGDLEELHQFAESIGLKRSWFQNHHICPHYDLTEKKRAMAVQRGAIEVTFVVMLRKWKERTRIESEGQS